MKQVTAAIIIKDNKVLIAQRASADKLANKWEFLIVVCKFVRINQLAAVKDEFY